MGKTGIAFAVFVIVLIIVSVAALSKRDSSGDASVTPVAENISPAPTGEDNPSAVASQSAGESETTMDQKKTYNQAPEMTIDPNARYAASLTTSKGVLKVVLDPKLAPVAVNNFVFLAREKFYDNTVFHRIIKGFMIQGGDPTGTGRGSPGYRFDDEPVTTEYSRGTIAMANSGPNTNGSQFFIMHQDYQLPKNYVIFGKIDPTDALSLTTLDAIAASDVTDNGMGETSKPVSPVTVASVTIEQLN